MIPGIVASQVSTVSIGDPYWSSVVSLLHFDGSGGSTTIVDETGRSWSVFGNAQLDTAVKKWGTASLGLDGTGDYLSTAHVSALSVDSGDLTIEAFVVIDVTGKIHTICNKRPSTSASEFSFYVDTTNKLTFAAFNSGSTVVALVSTATLTLGTIYHVAATRSGSIWSIFIDGNLEASGSQTSAPQMSTTPLLIGRDGFNTSRDLDGHIDDFRYTKGVARYTASFSPPSGPFPNHA